MLIIASEHNLDVWFDAPNSLHATIPAEAEGVHSAEL